LVYCKISKYHSRVYHVITVYIDDDDDDDDDDEMYTYTVTHLD